MKNFILLVGFILISSFALLAQTTSKIKVSGNCGMCKGHIEKAAKDAGYELKIGKFPFMASGKASAAGATEGFVKVIYDAKYGELLGCHMIGMNVTNLL